MRVIYAREKKREIVTNVVKGGVRKNAPWTTWFTSWGIKK